ncbi:MAG: preprotein translocase subunit SecG [Clostridia bacterium]|nr:preprotein translocase subunit SecG [Clostridia bacterium]
MQTAVAILHIVIAVALIVVVLFQSGKDAGLSGVIGGESSSSFYGKNKGKTKDAILGKVTTALAILFLITSLILNFYFKKTMM